MPIGIAAGVAAIAGPVLGGLFGGKKAASAGDTQAAAANQAAAATKAMYDQTRSDLAPYRNFGSDGIPAIQGQLPQLTSQFNPTQDTLNATPGYQFALNQGLQAVQNSASAKGLGLSGAAMKGAADYATGLANNTYQTQFNIDQANKTNAYNKLMGVVGMGQSAAAQTGAFGQQSAQNAGQFSTSGAAAQAAGQVGQANAITNGFNTGVNNYNNYNLANQLAKNNADNAGNSGANSNLLNRLIGY